MPEPFRSSLIIEFEGLDAKDSLVEAQQLGISMQGIGRLYRSTAHFYLVGEFAPRHRDTDIRVLCGPPQEGSLSYTIWLMLAHGRLALYPEMLAQFADLCVPEFVKSAVAKRSGQNDLAENAMDKIYDLAKGHEEIAKRVLDYAQQVEASRHRETEALRSDALEKLQDPTDIRAAINVVADKIGQVNANAMTEMVKPVGKSTRTLTHAKGAGAELVIDEPAAAVIRAKGDLELQDTTRIRARLGAVDTISRSCKIVSDEFDRPMRGKITDPALEQAQNVYTHALDNHTELILTGKAALKEGEVHMYYISDAKPISD